MALGSAFSLRDIQTNLSHACYIPLYPAQTLSRFPAAHHPASLSADVFPLTVMERMFYSVSWCYLMDDMIEINEKDHYLRVFILFTQTARVAAKYQDAYMKKKTGISDVWFIVLMAFYYDPTSSVTASQIAQWTDTDPNNVTTLINRMEREGLLESRRDEKDKRFVRIN